MDNQFSSENQPNKNGRRGKAKRTMLLDALKRAGKTEDGFYDELVARALLPNDNMLLKEVLIGLHPTPKNTMPAIEFEFKEGSTAAEKIDSLINAVASGDIPADVAKTVTDIIQSGLDALDRTELIERLERLEKLIKSQ